MSKVGGEDTYVVMKTPAKGHPVTDYVSARTFLLLRRDTLQEGPGGVTVPNTERYSDYRPVEGVMVAFQRVANNVGQGDIVTRIRQVKFGAGVPASEFRRQTK